jgi:preprotein translocase subunit YajC
MDKKQLTILIIVGIILLLAGGAIGFAIKSFNKVQLQKNEAVSSLSSKVITSVTAYGEITKIDGETLTISNAGETLSVLMANTAKVRILAPKEGSTTPVQQDAKFEDLKVGQKVNVIMKVSATGEMQGSSVVILPTPAVKK